MNDTRIGWTRTTVTSLWTGLVIYIASKLGMDIDPANPTVIIIIGLTSAIVWRLSIVLSKVKWLGWILFGVNAPPGYTESELEVAEPTA